MGAEHHHTAEFRGASFADADLNGATFRSCDLRGIRVTDSWLMDVNISGEIRNVVVNDVDVTAFVESELDRRHPERVALREMRTADDYRAMWATFERLWAQTLATVERLPESARFEGVDGEWSFAQTLRHLVFATDAWASRTILDEPMPYHRIGLTYASYPPEEAAKLGVELDAQPAFEEVMAVRASRVAAVRGIMERLTDAELERVCSRAPAPGYPEEDRTVGQCLRVLMGEECEHRRYMVRDLALLEARHS